MVLLEDSLSPDGGCRLFQNPQRIIRCHDAAEARTALEDIERALSEGFFCAGFLSYELGYLLEPKLSPLLPEDRIQPLIWMGVFKSFQELSRQDTDRYLQSDVRDPYRISNPRHSISKDDYLAAFDRVKDYIVAGDVYQINLTFKHLFDFAGDSLAFYRDLRRRQPVHYSACIRAEEFDLLSLSPELFVRTEGENIETRPMKGTASRGRTVLEDRSQADWLQNDSKSRAENLMIVDLLRNDLSRIAKIGSVQVPELFAVETYRTLLQMTSRVTARLKPDIGFADILASLFPCGSVTGAPKVRAMEIVNELEQEARGVYTGAVGMVGPGGDLQFNVAIRTLYLPHDGTAEMGIGSGLVFDSVGPAEYEECLLKANFLTQEEAPFHLLETMLWEPGTGYKLLSRHLERLKISADYFQYRCDEELISEALRATVRNLPPCPHRIRLLLDPAGVPNITATALADGATPPAYRYVLSDLRMNSANRFLYHKTTNRAFYEDELARLNAETGCDEVIFLNERGEVTEGSRHNVFVRHGDQLLTPPIFAGVLPGTLRQELIEAGDPPVVERTLTLEDLANADEVYLGNSVRGLVPAVAMTEETALRAAVAD